MIKASMMAALASKLEEEHITSPIDDKTVEAEVSASVEVSPEVQTQIDEAVTQAVDDVEAMTEASDDLEEVTEEAEDIEETTATLRAVVESIKENGGVIQPQLYAFLQKAGYLNLIGQLQSTAISKVTYPAVETMSTSALNKQYSDSILVGCENAITEFGKSVWKRIKAIFEKIKEFFQKIYTYITANEKRVTAANQSLQNISVDIDADNIKYSESSPTSDNMEQIGKAVETISKPLIDKVQKYMIGLSKFIEIYKTKKDGGSISDMVPKLDEKEFDAIAKLGEMKMGGADTLGKAGLTLDALQTSVYKNVLSCVKGMKELGPVISKLNSFYKTLNDVPNMVEKFSKDTAAQMRAETNSMFGDVSKISKGFHVLYTSCWKVVNSYLTACSAVVKAGSSKKEEK